MSRRLILCAGVLLALTFAVASQAGGWRHSSSSRSTSRSTRSVNTQSTIIRDEPSVMPGRRLDIDLVTGGGIHIEGVATNEVSVEYSDSEDKCPDAAFDVKQTETGVSVRSHYRTERNTHYCSMEIMIRVPRRYDIHIESSGGAVEIANVEGTIEGRTGGGELYLSRLNGSLDLKTGGGEITVKDSKLDGSIATGGGKAVLENVTGGLQASSGSGPVIRRGRSTKTI